MTCSYVLSECDFFALKYIPWSEKFKSLQSNHACICALEVQYICVTIVPMKCTHAKFELSRHTKALSVVYTHMVHQHSQVESTKRYSRHYIQYLCT